MTTTVDAPPPPPPTPPPVPAATPPPKSSSGCLKWGLIGCGTVIVLFAAFCAVLVIFVFGAIKRSDVYKGALQRAQNDSRVQAALGTPIEAGWIVKGSVNFKGGSGDAEITFPISGPKAKAEEHAVGTYDGSQWTYSTLTVTPEGGTPIDLLTTPP